MAPLLTFPLVTVLDDCNLQSHRLMRVSSSTPHNLRSVRALTYVTAVYVVVAELRVNIRFVFGMRRRLQGIGWN